MKFLKPLFLAPIVLGVSVANAAIIDFVQLTEGSGGLGESAWTTLNITNSEFSLDITGTKDGNAATAYLDYNHAGLGVCGLGAGTKLTTNLDTTRTGLSSNVCWEGSDDNVTTGEYLSFVFDTNVRIDKIWLNNTHDPDRNILDPDLITIDGSDYKGPGNGYAPTTSYSNYGSSVNNWLGSFNVNAGHEFTIAFNDQQFYVSGMEISAVPEPSILTLIGLGLFGLGFSRFRNKKS